MPWKETTPMNERVQFIASALKHDESVSALCERFGISRKTGYKWVARYRAPWSIGRARPLRTRTPFHRR